jgi:phospholipase/carboxylesterase
VPLGEVLEAPAGTRWLFPEAPLPSNTGIGGGRAWWQIDLARIQADRAAGRVRDLSAEIPQGLASARERLLTFLDELPRRLSIEYQKTVIGGFSQGAMLSCDAVLHADYPVAGLVQLSSNLLAQPIWQPLMVKRKGLRVFQSHGTRDDILPYLGAERLRDELSTSGLVVDWHPFRGGHEIPESIIMALNSFLCHALATS